MGQSTIGDDSSGSVLGGFGDSRRIAGSGDGLYGVGHGSTSQRSSCIVRRSTAIEQLASIELLCSDKTGTLTEGRMKVQHVWIPHPNNNEQTNRLLWECSAMCNNVRWHVKADTTLVIGAGDTTEVALLEAALNDVSILQAVEGSKEYWRFPLTVIAR